MRTIKIEINAEEERCTYCSFVQYVERQGYMCDIYLLDLRNEGDGLLRLKECKEAEIDSKS